MRDDVKDEVRDDVRDDVVRDDDVRDADVRDDVERDDDVRDDDVLDDVTDELRDNDRTSTEEALAAVGQTHLPGTMGGVAAPPAPLETERTEPADEHVEHAEYHEPAEQRAEQFEEHREPVEHVEPVEHMDEPQSGIWGETEARGLRDRWQEIQLQFVDDPQGAVDSADAFVNETVDSLTAAVAARREELSGWRSQNGDETERLRLALQKHREFLDNLLRL